MLTIALLVMIVVDVVVSLFAFRSRNKLVEALNRNTLSDEFVAQSYKQMAQLMAEIDAPPSRHGVR